MSFKAALELDALQWLQAFAADPSVSVTQGRCVAVAELLTRPLQRDRYRRERRTRLRPGTRKAQKAQKAQKGQKGQKGSERAAADAQPQQGEDEGDSSRRT